MTIPNFAPDFASQTLHHHLRAPKQGQAAQQVITEADFKTSWEEITQWPGYHPTPMHDLNTLSHHLGIGQIHYKDEGPRFGLGSFKALGGAYAALLVLQRQISHELGRYVDLSAIRAGQYVDIVQGITLVSATDGNHGRSLAWGCQTLGAPCRIYIHAEVSEGRAQAMRALGAEVVRIDGDYDASVQLAREEAEQNGWFVVSDTSWPGYVDPPRDVMAGYGVMTKETCDAMDQAPTHVFLQGGVGGLAASVAAGLRQYWGDQAPRVVIVEPDMADCLYQSAQQGRATTVHITEETMMAGLSCGEPSALAWAILSEEATDFVTIPDTLVAPTMRLLSKPLSGDPTIEAGESAVAGLAALIAIMQQPKLAQKMGLDAKARVLLIGSEGVTDPEIYARIMEGADG